MVLKGELQESKLLITTIVRLDYIIQCQNDFNLHIIDKEVPKQKIFIMFKINNSLTEVSIIPNIKLEINCNQNIGKQKQ